MDKSLDEIIKEAMEKKKAMGLGENESEQKPAAPQKSDLDDTTSYLISDADAGISDSGNSSSAQAAAADDSGVTIPQDVFDSILAKRQKPAESEKPAGSKEVMDYISTGADDSEEDLTSLGIAGKEGKKITDYTAKEYKKDSPDNFDKEYYDKYSKLSGLSFTEPERTTSTKKKKRLKKNGKKRWSKKRKIITVVLIILLIIALLIGSAAALIFHYIGKINIVSNPNNSIASSITDDDLTDDPDSPQDEIDALEAKIKANMEAKATSEPLSDENVINILIIGTDSRDTSTDRGRSDSMILMSINKNTDEIIMTSFLRDIYCYIPNVGYSRLNHAYAYGGAELLLDTLEQNFGIAIEKYITVNFSSFVDVVDAVDGVAITVTEDELQYVNAYLGEINSLEGYDKTDSTLSSAGTYTLNGRQALAYSRIRYVGTDFGRTERQRTVMTKVLEKAKDLSLTEIDNLLNVLLPELTTNLTEGEIFAMVLNMVSYLSYDTVSQCIPQDDDYSYLTISGMSVLGIDFDSSVEFLKKTIYHQ